MNGKTVDGLDGRPAVGQRSLDCLPRQIVHYQFQMCRLAPGGKWRNAGKIAGALLMIALLLLLCIAAASPAVHRAVCPNAGKPGDSCAVAAFAGGAVASSPAPAVLV
jgi:hypothetical protein